MRRLLALPLLLLPLATLAQEAAPRYTGDKELVRPEGYREWVFIGATLGMSYNEGEAAAAPEPPKFHNLYIAPAAYREYKKSGKFPEGTMLVMEIMTAASQVSINQRGNFEDKSLGIEVLFYRLHSGIPGTPMPGIPATISVEDRWSVIEYVLSIPYEPINQPPAMFANERPRP
jgi:hypothetical protein